jgi:hypothetical protein
MKKRIQKQIKYRKLHRTFSNVVIVFVSFYLCWKCIIFFDAKVYLLAIISDVMQNFDISRSIKGGRALDPSDFVDF